MSEYSRSRSSTSSSSLSLQMNGYKKLCIFVNKATNLKKGDAFGLSDPYLRMSVKGAEVAGTQIKKTGIIKKTLDPVWAEELHFWVRGDYFSLMIDVFDENKLIKDDFLGRQMIHFDFLRDDLRPPVVPSLNNRRIQDVGRSVTLRLKAKYSHELLHGQYRPYINDLRSQFFLKRLHRNRWAEGNRGKLFLSYVCIDPSDDFEHIELPSNEATPTVATPTQTPANGASTQQEREEENEEEEETRVELPPGWEERRDLNGRRVYVNHLTRGTSLRRPNTRSHDTEATPTQPQPPERRVFYERHTSVDVIEERSSVEDDEDEGEEGGEEERPPQPDAGTNLHLLDSVTISNHPYPPSPSPTPTPPIPSAPPLTMDTPQTTPTQSTPQATPTTQGEQRLLTVAPSPRPILNTTPQPTLLAVSPQTTPTFLPRATPTPPVVQPRLNLGAAAARIPMGATPHHSLGLQRAAQSLPQGWQAGMTPDGRVYYINHMDKTTTWEKPRVQERQIRPSPLSSSVTPTTSPHPLSVEQDSSLPPGWEQRKASDGRDYYVDHNTQTTSWDHPNSSSSSSSSQKEDLGPLPPGWEVKQMADGRLFYVDHATHSTQWEDPRLTAKNKPTAKMKYSRDYKQKYSNFKLRLPKHRQGAPNILELPIRRDNIFEDSFRAVTNVKVMSHFHSRLYVKFAGESGLDYGGLAREWFFLLSHEMFSPYYGLFEYAASDDYTLQISPESGTYNEHHIDYFKFIGRMFGLAIYHQHLLDAFFIRPFYKMILDKPVTLDDMQSVDEELYNSVKYILENDPEPLCLTFSANKTVFGEVLEEELKVGGSNISVTEANKREYIHLLIKWKFTDRVQKQIDAIKQGIADIFPLHLLKVFDPRELEYLLGGLASIDVEDWKKNTELVGYSPHDQVIVWFWKAVETYDAEMRARLLQFVTGTSKVPMNGFAELQGSNGPRKFCIKKLGIPTALPRSHTCFNRIDLPPYGSYHKLRENLKLAVENTEGFEGVD